MQAPVIVDCFWLTAEICKSGNLREPAAADLACVKFKGSVKTAGYEIGIVGADLGETDQDEANGKSKQKRASLCSA